VFLDQRSTSNYQVFVHVSRPKKFLHAVQDSEYRQGIHDLHEMHKLSEQVCRYDLDQVDVCWLDSYNLLRAGCGQCVYSNFKSYLF